MANEKTVVIRDFDEIFHYIGEAGIFQILVYVMLGLPSYFSGYQNIAMTFLAPDVEHWCEVDELTGYPHEQQKYVGMSALFIVPVICILAVILYHCDAAK